MNLGESFFIGEDAITLTQLMPEGISRSSRPRSPCDNVTETNTECYRLDQKLRKVSDNCFPDVSHWQAPEGKTYWKNKDKQKHSTPKNLFFLCFQYGFVLKYFLRPAHGKVKNQKSFEKNQKIKKSWGMEGPPISVQKVSVCFFRVLFVFYFFTNLNW